MCFLYVMGHVETRFRCQDRHLDHNTYRKKARLPPSIAVLIASKRNIEGLNRPNLVCTNGYYFRPFYRCILFASSVWDLREWGYPYLSCLEICCVDIIMNDHQLRRRHQTFRSDTKNERLRLLVSQNWSRIW